MGDALDDPELAASRETRFALEYAGEAVCSSIATIRAVITTQRWTLAASPITSPSTNCNRAWSVRSAIIAALTSARHGYIMADWYRPSRSDPGVRRVARMESPYLIRVFERSYLHHKLATMAHGQGDLPRKWSISVSESVSWGV